MRCLSTERGYLYSSKLIYSDIIAEELNIYVLLREKQSQIYTDQNNENYQTIVKIVCLKLQSEITF